MNIPPNLDKKLKKMAIEWVFAEYPQLHYSASDESYAIDFDKIISHSIDLSDSGYIERDIYNYHNDLSVPLLDIYHCMIETSAMLQGLK